MLQKSSSIFLLTLHNLRKTFRGKFQLNVSLSRKYVFEMWLGRKKRKLKEKEGMGMVITKTGKEN